MEGLLLDKKAKVTYLLKRLLIIILFHDFYGNYASKYYGVYNLINIMTTILG